MDYKEKGRKNYSKEVISSKGISRRGFITGLTALMASTTLAGCADLRDLSNYKLSNYEKGKTKDVSIDRVLYEVGMGGYSILVNKNPGLMEGSNKKSPDVVFLRKNYSDVSFDGKGNFEKVNISLSALEKILKRIEGVGSDAGATEAFLPNDASVGYTIPRNNFLELYFDARIKEYTLNSADGGASGGGSSGAGSGSGSGGSGSGGGDGGGGSG